MKPIRLVLAATIAATFSVPAQANYALHAWEDHFPQDYAPKGRLTLHPRLYYYFTSTNFDTDAATFVSALENYNRLQIDVDLNYGLGENWVIYARPGWARVQVNHPTLGGAGYGLPDQGVGTAYRVMRNASGLAIDLQLQIEIPAYSNTTSTTNQTPFLGDGSLDITGGGFVAIPFRSPFTQTASLIGGAGYTWRSKQFSASIPWSVDLRFMNPMKGWEFAAAALGQFSLSTDPTTSYGVGERVLTGGGGSYASHAINPSLLSFRGQVGYRASPKTAYQVDFTQVVWGKNAAKAWTITAGVDLRFGGGDAPTAAEAETTDALDTREPHEKAPAEYAKSNQGFVTYAMEAHVTRVNDRLNLIKINKGSDAGLKVGDKLDVFSTKNDGSAVSAIARAQVTSTKENEAALRVIEYFREVWIETGFIVKKPLD
ncbi:MAG: hypothetical protein AB7P04_14935 [Bacteriovoracia bacterium]